MITTPTVIVLGAGASVPYGFPSGEELLNRARRLTIDELAELLPRHEQSVKYLHEVLAGTLDTSIDAILETSPTIRAAGKRLIATLLLESEREARAKHCNGDPKLGTWLELLFRAMAAPTIQEFTSCNRVTFITYNYDRLLEYRLALALSVKYSQNFGTCHEAVLCNIGVIHLHGQLGVLAHVANHHEIARIPFGGSPADERHPEQDILEATEAIRIVDEAVPTDRAFHLAREKLAEAERVLFLGFGYARQNLDRLQVARRISPEARLYLCRFLMTDKEFSRDTSPFFDQWRDSYQVGSENENIRDFLRNHADALA